MGLSSKGRMSEFSKVNVLCFFFKKKIVTSQVFGFANVNPLSEPNKVGSWRVESGLDSNIKNA